MEDGRHVVYPFLTNICVSSSSVFFLVQDECADFKLISDEKFTALSLKALGSPVCIQCMEFFLFFYS